MQYLQQLKPQQLERTFTHSLTSHVPVPRHKPVIWMHVHKSGGTGMCTLAKLNNETFMHGVDPVSCNFFPSDDFSHWVPVRRPNCDDYRMRWAASGFTWSQFERPFLQEDFCPDQFFYGTIIRHPVSLARSGVNFIDTYQGTWTGNLWSAYVSCLEAKQAGRAAACASSHTWLHNPSGMWMYFDNFMVRLFGGLDVWNLPPGAVNATHRQLALDRLNSLDLVLTLEEFSSNQTKSTLAKAFGWSHFEAADMRLRYTGIKLTDFSESDAKRIEKLNSHDMILYETFREREAARR